MPFLDLPQSSTPGCDLTDVVSQSTAESNSTAAEVKQHRRPGDRFSYTTLDSHVAALNTCTQVHEYIFDPAQFARFDYPATWPAGRPWPPRTVEELCCAPDEQDWPCVGDQYLPTTICRARSCKHTLTDWATSNKDWETHFELRETADRGIGVFAKHAFKALDILGWYAGDVTPYGVGTGIYALSLTIGKSSSPQNIDFATRGLSLHVEPCADGVGGEAAVEAQVQGNWTRFINHACTPNTAFVSRRVGQMRIMAVKARKDIAVGEELTIHYGDTYFTSRTCLCGAANCLEMAKTIKKAVEVVNAE